MHTRTVIWLFVLLSSGGVIAADASAQQVAPPAPHGGGGPRPPVQVVPQSESVDVNRPKSPFDCELPIGENWYGSRARCLAYLCGGENVYNEYVFDADGRRRKNPCYGQNPTEFPE